MSNIALAARFARREFRGGLRGFRVFVICLTLGVAAIAGVGSVSESVTGGIERDARSLLGGDISLRLLHRPITAEQRSYISDRGDLSEVIEMRAMARSAGDRAAKRSLVELKAVDGAYPLVGTLETESGEELGAVLGQEGRPLGRGGGAKPAHQAWSRDRRRTPHRRRRLPDQFRHQAGAGPGGHDNELRPAGDGPQGGPGGNRPHPAGQLDPLPLSDRHRRGCRREGLGG